MKAIIPLLLGALFIVSAQAAGSSSDIVSMVVDLNGDNISEKLSLQFSEPDESNQYHATLLIESDGKIISEFLGGWFGPDFTRLDVLTIGQNIKPFIVVDSAGGAHSENRQIFRFNGKSIEKILNITSDVPSITESDVDGDGIVEIIAKQRDYNKDPIVDSREIVYKWDGARFVKVK